MIGDARAAGKRHSTRDHGPEHKVHNANGKGRSFQTVTPAASDGGGDKEQKHTAKRMHAKGTRPGVGVADKQAPSKQKEHHANKHVDQGQLLDQWCAGKRKHYR